MPVAIYIEDHHIDLLTDVKDLARTVHPCPRELRDVHQSVCAAQVYKGAKVDQVAYDAGADLAGLERSEQLIALLVSPFSGRGAL